MSAGHVQRRYGAGVNGSLSPLRPLTWMQDAHTSRAGKRPRSDATKGCGDRAPSSTQPTPSALPIPPSHAALCTRHIVAIPPSHAALCTRHIVAIPFNRTSLPKVQRSSSTIVGFRSGCSIAYTSKLSLAFRSVTTLL